MSNKTDALLATRTPVRHGVVGGWAIREPYAVRGAFSTRPGTAHGEKVIHNACPEVPPREAGESPPANKAGRVADALELSVGGGQQTGVVPFYAHVGHLPEGRWTSQ